MSRNKSSFIPSICVENCPIKPWKNRIISYREKRIAIGYTDQQNRLPLWQRAHPEYKGVHAQVLQNAFQRLDPAFVNFFEKTSLSAIPGGVGIDLGLLSRIATSDGETSPKIRCGWKRVNNACNANNDNDDQTWYRRSMTLRLRKAEPRIIEPDPT